MCLVLPQSPLILLGGSTAPSGSSHHWFQLVKLPYTVCVFLTAVSSPSQQRDLSVSCLKVLMLTEPPWETPSWSGQRALIFIQLSPLSCKDWFLLPKLLFTLRIQRESCTSSHHHAPQDLLLGALLCLLMPRTICPYSIWAVLFSWLPPRSQSLLSYAVTSLQKFYFFCPSFSAGSFSSINKVQLFHPSLKSKTFS